jgi:hypothetical protein
MIMTKVFQFNVSVDKITTLIESGTDIRNCAGL